MRAAVCTVAAAAVPMMAAAQTAPAQRPGCTPRRRVAGFKSWSVVTLNLHEGDKVTEMWSIGQNVETVPQGAIPDAALAWFSPSKAQLAAMVQVSASIPCDTQTCKQWHYTGPKDAQGTSIELFYMTRTHFANGTWTEVTCAFDGNAASTTISSACLRLLLGAAMGCCAGREIKKSKEATETAISNALTWACSSGGVDCSAVNKYYHMHISGGAGSCDFSGTAEM
eukprot:gene30260-61601_t